MKLNIAICDDLGEERGRLAAIVQSYCAQRQITVELKLFSSGDELLAGFRSGLFHILFLDIYMPGTNGMETARRIRQLDASCCILFATTSEEHGLDSYAVQASDYLVKPFQEEEVTQALDWCIEQITDAYQTLTVSTDSGLALLSLRDIHYIEIQKHTACLHTDSGIITTRRGLDELEQEISHPDFLRCHRSFLVNMNHIDWLEKNSFRLHSGELVPIGSTSTSRVKDQFMRWAFVKSWERK